MTSALGPSIRMLSQRHHLAHLGVRETSPKIHKSKTPTSVGVFAL